MVTIPAGAREVLVKITARTSDGVEASWDFVFTVDRQPPRMRTVKIFYRDEEKEAWKEMPKEEWRGNFWRIEVEPSEQLQAASANILYATIAGKAVVGKSAAGESELVFTATLSSNWREVAVEGTSKDFSSQDEISCLLKMQDLAGWQNSINLGKWKAVKAQEQRVFQLRSKPDQNLTEDDVKDIIKQYGFYCSDYEWTKKWSNPKGNGIANDFIPQQNGEVTFDRTTNLIWQQSGSPDRLTFEQVHKYVEGLNRQKFAGFSDWRLPTLEEAMSLITPNKQRALHIDEKFDHRQGWIWTSDMLITSVWVVDFAEGSCYVRHPAGPNGYVRVVRSTE
jgi:hypothetical protein